MHTRTISIPGGLGISSLSRSLSDFSDLSVTAQWKSNGHKYMSAPIVRGMAYATMEYYSAQPVVMAEHSLGANGRLIVDQNSANNVTCNGKPFKVEREMELLLEAPVDSSWLIFVSNPLTFTCKNTLTPTDEPRTILTSVSPIQPLTVVRAALLSNCTTGKNPVYCTPPNSAQGAKEREACGRLLRTHADLYPTGLATVCMRVRVGVGVRVRVGVGVGVSVRSSIRVRIMPCMLGVYACACACGCGCVCAFIHTCTHYAVYAMCM